jgi:hypothetical protein
MATKLTLRMDERLIEVAKRHAAAHATYRAHLEREHA